MVLNQKMFFFSVFNQTPCLARRDHQASLSHLIWGTIKKVNFKDILCATNRTGHQVKQKKIKAMESLRSGIRSQMQFAIGEISVSKLGIFIP